LRQSEWEGHHAVPICSTIRSAEEALVHDPTCLIASPSNPENMAVGSAFAAWFSEQFHVEAFSFVGQRNEHACKYVIADIH
jgi:hypothetical protein